MSSTFYFLLFVSVYVIAVSTFTYTSSSSNVDLQEVQGENKVRVKRIAPSENEFLKDYWTGNVSLNKCCAQKQYLNQRYQCQDEDTLLPPEKILDKMALYMLDEKLEKNTVNLSRVEINKFNYILNLRDENAFAVNWSSPTLEESFAFSQEDLSLLQLNTNKTKVLMRFLPTSFCLDFLLSQNVLVAFVNPCTEKLCIQKCCPRQNYYNVIEKKCTPDPKIPEYTPTFFNGSNKIGSDPSYYLIPVEQKCLEPNYINPLQVNHVVTDIYIQEDGSLQTTDNSTEQGTYNKKDYCAEQFSDGNLENTFVNGFICPTKKEIKRSNEDSKGFAYNSNDYFTNKTNEGSANNTNPASANNTNAASANNTHEGSANNTNAASANNTYEGSANDTYEGSANNTNNGSANEINDDSKIDIQKMKVRNEDETETTTEKKASSADIASRYILFQLVGNLLAFLLF